jgi:hypothetical protein
MGSKKPLLVPCIAALALGAANAFGQTECVKGVRDTTAAERQAMTSALEAALAALPPAPEGWVIGGYEEISVVQRLCMDYDTIPLESSISRTYNRVDDAAAREEFQAAAAAALRASMAERQQRVDALTAKNQEIAAQLGPAAERGDQARVDAIYRELDEINKQMEAVLNEGPSVEQLAAIGGEMTRDRIMTISVRVNASSAQTRDMSSTAPPAGAQHAFRGEVMSHGSPEVHTVLLFGSWRPRGADGDMETARRGTESIAAPHGVAVTVRADPARVDGLLATIKLDAFAALVR